MATALAITFQSVVESEVAPAHCEGTAQGNFGEFGARPASGATDRLRSRHPARQLRCWRPSGGGGEAVRGEGCCIDVEQDQR